MSHLYVFCATAGAVAYGVGVAVGMWAQKRKMMEGIEGTEITLEQFRYLKMSNERLEKRARIAEHRYLTAEHREDESRDKLISIHNALMAAYGELDWRESKGQREHATYTSATVAVPADERPVRVVYQKGENEIAEEVLCWHDGAWWRKDPATGRPVLKVCDADASGWKEDVE